MPWIEIGLWLAASWVCAYALRITAPSRCPNGLDNLHCRHMHLLHVSRQDPVFDSILGVFWPLVLLVGFGTLFVRSVEATAQITPTPTRKPSSSKALEIADQQLKEMRAELDAHFEERLKQTPLEGKIIDPREH
jgi:hypothetical protein